MSREWPGKRMQQSTVAETWLRRCARVSLIAGAAMIAWWTFLFADARLAQHNARRSLELSSEAARRGPTAQAGRTERVVAPLHAPRQGDVIALLTIPRIELSAAVLHGSDAQTLRRGPGHLENTALPGQPGNSVIAGHRDSFFRPLRHIQVGDDVFVSTAEERIHYRVSSLDVVEPRELGVLAPTDVPTLTLITCFPFWVLDDAPERFIVRATRVAVPDVAPAAVKATLPKELVTPPPPEPSPTVPATPPSRPAAVTPREADDVTLVRELIERVRLSYNARLMRDPAFRRDDLLAFDGCDISIEGDHATATCVSPAATPDGVAPTHRTFALERGRDGWSVRLVTIGAAPDGL